LCSALAAAGQGARVHLVCEEAELPYQRPPLSKAFLKNAEETLQLHRAESWFADSGITTHLGDPAVSLSPADRQVRLKSGFVLPYAWLVLATGTRARRLPGLPDDLHNVAVLRHASDAHALRSRLGAATRVTVLGGGFIGLEIAATARALGKSVTVLEAAPRLLARSVSSELSDFVLQTHRSAGIDVRLSVHCAGFEVSDGRLVALTVDGVREGAELLVMGIGAVPETALAAAAGIACDNGIVVDAHLRTSAPQVLAIGDCTNFPEAGSARRLRLESVQNANDQAKTALATMLGKDEPYRALPWFWSEQGSLRLQMAGLMPEGGARHRRPGATAASFSILHYAGERLACVESVNAPLDHMAARKLLEAGKSPPAAVAADPAVPLKSLL
jgi:3-phenylpropionate/trans-cinnamate dioxygenase ferredoxin reductase subunit